MEIWVLGLKWGRVNVLLEKMNIKLFKMGNQIMIAQEVMENLREQNYLIASSGIMVIIGMHGHF